VNYRRPLAYDIGYRTGKELGGTYRQGVTAASVRISACEGVGGVSARGSRYDGAGEARGDAPYEDRGCCRVGILAGSGGCALGEGADYAGRNEKGLGEHDAVVCSKFCERSLFVLFLRV